MYGYLSTLDDVMELEKFNSFGGSLKLFALVVAWPVTLGRLISLKVIGNRYLIDKKEREDEERSPEV